MFGSGQVVDFDSDRLFSFVSNNTFLLVFVNKFCSKSEHEMEGAVSGRCGRGSGHGCQENCSTRKSVAGVRTSPGDL